MPACAAVWNVRIRVNVVCCWSLGQQQVVALVDVAGGVGGAIVEPAGAAGRITAATAVRGAEEVPVDVHEDVDAGVVVERHLGGALTRAAGDQMLLQELGDDARIVGNAARRLPHAGAGEHRRHRARAVEPDPPAVVAGSLDADAGDAGLPRDRRRRRTGSRRR